MTKWNVDFHEAPKVRVLSPDPISSKHFKSCQFLVLHLSITVKFTSSYYNCCLLGFWSHENIHCVWSQCMMRRFTTSYVQKHGSWRKTYFLSLKSVLAFQTLMMAMPGKWATTCKRIVFLESAAWIDLSSNADTSVQLFKHQKAQFGSLKRADDLWVYRGFMMLVNHKAGRHARYFKEML